MSEEDKTFQRPRPQPAASTGSAAFQIAPGSVLKDTYRIEAELGSGGMGTVFLATHLGLEKRMAVKVLSPKAIASPESLARFGREARVAGKVNHPAMTHVIDFGVEKNTPYIVMEYVDGVELAEYIERQGPMPPRQAVSVMRQIVSLLHVAHSLGIVHRDLKPANIKVVQAGPDDGQFFVKVLDFGIAKVLGDISGQLTSEGMMVGTPAYMAPEQISGQPIDGRTDLYAAGLIFHELLSGVRAFRGETIARILHAQMNEPPPPISLPLPEVLIQTLRKFYEKRPEDRFQDAAAADRALMACEDALRSSPANAVASGARQGGVAPTPAVTPEALSGTMVRPGSEAASAGAAESGGLSGTMVRPDAGANNPAPAPVPSSPSRPVTDRQLAPAQFGSDGRPAPSRPPTDRQPAPAPLVVADPQAPVVPAPVPAPAPAPAPMRRPVPAQGQHKQSSGVGKALLIGGLVLGVSGCLIVSGLGFLAWMSGMGEANHHADSPPFAGQHPPGAFPNPSHPPQPKGGQKVFGLDDGLIDVPGAQQAGLTDLEPGCYVNEVIFESDQDLGPNAPWEYVTLVSREQVECSSQSRGKLSAQARQIAEDWPFGEEILKVEDGSRPQPVKGEPGLLHKRVRIHTRVSADQP
ncbi:MAG TPA: serine/threonine-protein kinase [Hyalangium sp.]|nr:serine/threonine-protein kinase [Hyalangium sp.]